MSRKNKNQSEMFNKYKMEVANELGVDLTSPNLTSREAGSVGGEMVKRIINSYKEQNK